jgi:hypothetical protein
LKEAGDAFVAEGITTTDKLPGSARTNRQTAIDSMASAQKLFAGFDFVNATFAAQKAWRAAAAYRDTALGLPPGTSEIEHGTNVCDAGACPSAKLQ